MYSKTYTKMVECTAYMTPELARECKSYSGCPRGARAAVGILKEMDVKTVTDVLLRSGTYILKGTDDEFVCIPKGDYESILDILRV